MPTPAVTTTRSIPNAPTGRQRSIRSGPWAATTTCSPRCARPWKRPVAGWPLRRHRPLPMSVARSPAGPPRTGQRPAPPQLRSSRPSRLRARRPCRRPPHRCSHRPPRVSRWAGRLWWPRRRHHPGDRRRTPAQRQRWVPPPRLKPAATPAPTAFLDTPPPRRNRTPWWIAGGVALAALVGTGIALVVRDDGSSPTDDSTVSVPDSTPATTAASSTTAAPTTTRAPATTAATTTTPAPTTTAAPVTEAPTAVRTTASASRRTPPRRDGGPPVMPTFAEDTLPPDRGPRPARPIRPSCAVSGVRPRAGFGALDQRGRYGERHRTAFAVADGMGGRHGGAVAARAAVDALLERLGGEPGAIDWRSVITESNEAVRRAATAAGLHHTGAAAAALRVAGGGRRSSTSATCAPTGSTMARRS